MVIRYATIAKLYESERTRGVGDLGQVEKLKLNISTAITYFE